MLNGHVSYAVMTRIGTFQHETRLKRQLLITELVTVLDLER